jgi:predicted nucleic acid-binding protein
MRFLLDTDVLSSFRKKAPHPAIVQWVARMTAADIATTVVSVTEIQRGIERARHHHPHIASQAETWLEGLLALGQPAILPLTSPAARVLGRMYETAALRHFIVTDPTAKAQSSGADLGIAAIAISVGAAIATLNTRHFAQIHQSFTLPGLFNPATGDWNIPFTPTPIRP